MSERDDAERRELRIAPVMTGGTSLAVWIGGVTAELYSVVNREPGAPPTSANDVYGTLLELTSTDAIVDVITGTSAGGLNGVLLATGWALRVPTETIVELRELWLELGSIEALLRKPSERHPPSLLRGDDYFWPQLTEVLRRIEKASTIVDRTPSTSSRSSKDPTQRPRPTDLLVTVTTLAGEPTRRMDDIDQQLNETKQAHTLRFDTDDFGATKGWAERLALAARTSASIPGVFEASYLPIRDVHDPKAADTEGGRPAFASDKSSFKTGRWAVDGGVLVNEPLAAALERVWKRDAGSEVRRVALFVNPTPSGAAALIPDDSKDPPSLVKVVSSTFTAPRNIGISSDIDRLREHNRLTRKAVDVRRGIGDLTGPSPGLGIDVNGMAGSLFTRFRILRTADSVTSMLERNAPPALAESSTMRRQVEQALIDASRSETWLPKEFGAWSPTSWELPIRPAVGDGNGDVRDGASGGAGGGDPRGAAMEDEGAVPVGPIRADDDDGFGDGTWMIDDWPWGLASIEYAASVLLELIVRAYRLPVERNDQGEMRSDVRTCRTNLGILRRRIHERLQAIDDVRAIDNEFWRAALEKEPEDLGAWAMRCYEVWPDQTLLHTATFNDERKRACKRLLSLEALRLAVIGVDLCRLLEWVDALPEPATDAAADEIAAIRSVRSIIWPLTEGPPTDPRLMLRRLVAMHVVAVVFGDTNRRPALVDLIEVSWSAANALDPERKPAEKLAGTEFSRLGAFIKPSWRANDWMWGRMDGAYQLVLLLLDPVRLRQLNRSKAEVIAKLGLPDGDDAVSRRVAAELDYLDHATKPAPRSLPESAAVVAFALQRQIAKQEMPHVYDAVQRSREDGAREGDAGDFRRAFERVAGKDAKGTVPDADVADLVKRCRIGDESAGEELGQDMLTRTGGRVAIVAANMATGERAGVPWPAKIAAPIRQIGLAIYAITQSTTTSSKTGIGLSAALFAFAGAIIAMRLLGTDLNVGLVVLASLIMVIGATVAIMRSGVFAQLPVVLALLVVALALLGDDITSVITTQPDTGWKQSLFLDKWSGVTIVLIIGSISWLLSFVNRCYYGIRRYRRERNLARLEDPGAWSGVGERASLKLPPWPWRLTVETIVTVLVIPGLFILQKPFFRFLFEGSADGWRNDVIRFGTFLAGKQAFVVLLGLVLVGIFIGLAWDRGIRRFVALCYIAVRRVVMFVSRTAGS
jgi:predicted acylesterase/phospholipase RssA